MLPSASPPWAHLPCLVTTALAALFLAVACADGRGEYGLIGASERYSEGEVTIAVEMLDTGLLKGNAVAEGADDWRVTAIRVTALDPNGASWAVLEFPAGVGSRKATEFFEVAIQELDREEQLEITVTVTFESDVGESVERQATDRWPP